jgi:transcriptional regulator with XRE-family HTH domain
MTVTDEIDLTTESTFPTLSSEELTRRREKLGLSMAQLGAACRLTYSTIYSYERRPERGIPPYITLLLEYLELKAALRTRRAAETKVEQLLNLN